MFRYICTYIACPSNSCEDENENGWSDHYVNNRVLGRTVEERRIEFEELHQKYFHPRGHLHKIKRVRKKNAVVQQKK